MPVRADAGDAGAVREFGTLGQITVVDYSPVLYPSIIPQRCLFINIKFNLLPTSLEADCQPQ
jgi:hypothetical protein